MGTASSTATDMQPCACVALGNLTGKNQGARKSGFKWKTTPGYHSDPPNTSAYH